MNTKTILKFCTLSLCAFTTLHASSDTSAIDRVNGIAKLTKTLGIVEKYYVDKLEFNKIINKTIAGLMQNLDPHSSFLDEKSLKDMQTETSGEFGGLGITIGMKDGALTVISPIEDTPADKAGLKSGDIILKINNESTLGMSINDAVSKMKGKKGTSVMLTIVRKGEAKPFNVKITRDIIKIQSVYSKLIKNDNILYIRVTSFNKNVVPKVKEILKSNPKVSGIILDLRNNPGGLLNQAVGLVDLFVDKGIIVSQKGRKGGENIVYTASARNTLSHAPMAVLVNGGSASASEIVSGALQDDKRAVIIGEKTFGKGSVQLIIPIDRLEALRLTIAKYYLPSGRTIQAVGLTPDITVHPGKVPQDSADTFTIKESELKKHLQSELQKIDNNSTKSKIKVDDKNIITNDQINNDIQLKTAIDAIKIFKIKEIK